MHDGDPLASLYRFLPPAAGSKWAGQEDKYLGSMRLDVTWYYGSEGFRMLAEPGSPVVHNFCAVPFSRIGTGKKMLLGFSLPFEVRIIHYSIL